MILQSIVTSMPMFVCAFFAVLLLSDLRGRAERRRLFFFFLVATLLYLGHCLFFNRELTHVAWADTAYAFSNMAVYPLFFLYLSSLVCDPEVRRRHRWQLILLPAMLCTAVIALLYGLMTEEEHDQFVYGYLYNAPQVSLSGLASWQAVAHNVAKSIFALQIIPVVAYGRRYLMRFNKRVEENYSEMEGRSVHALIILLWLFLATSLVSFVCNIVGRQWFGASMYILAVPSVLFSVLLFAIGRCGLYQSFTITELLAEEQDITPIPSADRVLADSVEQQEQQAPGQAADESAAPADTEDAQQEETLQKRIIRRVRDERLYLQHDLKLNELALLMGTNRTYLAQAILKETGETFNDFINHQRIQYAQLLQAENPDMSVSEVMYRCGFSSYSSFHRNYLKFARES